MRDLRYMYYERSEVHVLCEIRGTCIMKDQRYMYYVRSEVHVL